MLNSKSRYYPYKMGVNFCGYRIFTTHKLLRTSNKKKIKKNIQNWNKKYINNKLILKSAIQSINSWLAHSSHCNSYKLQQKMLNKCNFLFTPSVSNQIEQNLIADIEKQGDIF